jgi:prepilin signal peptidase PulO-like enzyme (type II secretory pathway)
MVINLFIFVLGLCLGSFLNAMLGRYILKKTPGGRSACPSCNHVLAWYDLVPLLSWVFLSAKCRYCKKKISAQYPLVELGSGLIALALGQRLNLGNSFWNFVDGSGGAEGLLIFGVTLSIFMLLFWIALYDFKTKEIPNGANFAFVALAAAYLLLSSYFGILDGSIISHLLAGLAFFGFFYLFVVLSSETWMGGGDAKLALGIGILLGPWLSFVTLLLASVTGSFYGIASIWYNKKNSRSKKQKTWGHEIPFGPFLVLATLISFLYGSQIVDWYVNILLS